MFAAWAQDAEEQDDNTKIIVRPCGVGSITRRLRAASGRRRVHRVKILSYGTTERKKPKEKNGLEEKKIYVYRYDEKKERKKTIASRYRIILVL